ncbi:MAG: sigma-70 family RNA polymerase sigma factor [Spirochaetes bacterium]|nr:sigma-70 family RNA polymerase sigma factor [Spirochaetota bacterium]
MPAELKKRDIFSGYFVDYYPMVFNAVVTKVSSQDDAEDICQEVFIALYNHLDGIQNVRAWLYGTLKNMVLKYYKEKYTGHENIENFMEDAALSFVNGFRDTRIVINGVLKDALSDEEERNLFELIALHKYSYSETARVLGLTKRKVEYSYKKIAAKITQLLRERGISNIEDLL